MHEVAAPSGSWRGRGADGVVVFHGIPYARAARFAPPEREPKRSGTGDAIAPGPAAPQLRSRLEAVMGAPQRFDQSEDCLTVTLTMPEGAQPGSLPVMVWLHGGAYLSGSGEWNLYDTTKIVRETAIVAVSVNYRLGVLGYLRAPGISPGNLGLLDQVTALEWVRDNIEAFGGDPTRVTAAGQSAGAQSIVAMLGIDRARTLFARAIVQSAPLGLDFQTHDRAQKVAEVFLNELGADPRSAAVTELLAAQGRMARRLAGRAGLDPAPPLLPLSDTDPLPDEQQWRTILVNRAADHQVMIGNTADEMEAFWGPNPALSPARRVPVLGPRVVHGVQRIVQNKIFDAPVLRFADLLAGADADVYNYRFGPLHPDNPFGACHTIELPLLFSRGETWRDAPMVRPLSAQDIDAIGTRTRRYWGEFVHTGHIADPGWPRHRPRSRYWHALP